MPSGGFNPLQYYTGQILAKVLAIHGGSETSQQTQALQQTILHYLENVGDLNHVPNPQSFIDHAAHSVAGSYNWGGGGGGNNNNGGGGGTTTNPPAPPSPPSTSGSGGSSSSGGGSSGVTYTPPTPPDFANYVAQYRAIVQAWGIKIDKHIQNLIQNAAHNKAAAPGPGPYDFQYSPWSTDRFMQALRQTQAYHDRFV